MRHTLVHKGWEEASQTDAVPQFTFASQETKQIRAMPRNATGPGWDAVLEGENSVSSIRSRCMHTRPLCIIYAF